MDTIPKSSCCLITPATQHQIFLLLFLMDTIHRPPQLLIPPKPHGPSGCLFSPKDTLFRLTSCLISPKTHYTATLVLFPHGPHTLVTISQPFSHPVCNHSFLSLETLSCLLLLWPWPWPFPAPTETGHAPGLTYRCAETCSSTCWTTCTFPHPPGLPCAAMGCALSSASLPIGSWHWSHWFSGGL